MHLKCLALTVLMILFGAGCSQEKSQYLFSEVVYMKISSPAFGNNGSIPSVYTCDGENISPPLDLSSVPKDALSLVLVSDDPDAPMGTWTHWVVFNIPPGTKAIPEGTEPKGMQGITSFRKTGYGGPCPPSGTHRYFFKVYALDAMLSLSPGSTKESVEKAMEGHILAKAELIGRYKRI